MNRFGPVSVSIKQVDTILVGHQTRESVVLLIPRMVVETPPCLSKYNSRFEYNRKACTKGMNSSRFLI